MYYVKLYILWNLYLSGAFILCFIISFLLDKLKSPKILILDNIPYGVIKPSIIPNREICVCPNCPPGEGTEDLLGSRSQFHDQIIQVCITCKTVYYSLVPSVPSEQEVSKNKQSKVIPFTRKSL